MPDANPITPFDLGTQVRDPDAMAQLIQSGGVLGRLGVANNPRCPADLLRLLALDDGPTTRLSALLHPHCPDSTRSTHLDELPALLAEVLALPALDPAAAASLTRAVEQAIAGGDG